MLNVVNQLHASADALVDRYASRLTAAHENSLDAMCDRAIELLIGLQAQGLLTAAEVASWFTRFESLMDHLTQAYVDGFIPFMTLVQGASNWTEYVRAVVG